MPTVGADFNPRADVAAGGVLAGSYPNPTRSSDETVVSKATLATIADLRHSHVAASITEGQLHVDQVPTSTQPATFAVPRADDVRLSSSTSTKWNFFDDTQGEAFPGQAPKYDGDRYVPSDLPSGPTVFDAGFTRKGVITLTGDLRGTADAPRVLRTTPLHGFQQLDPLTWPVDLSVMSVANFYIVLNRRYSEFDYDYYLDPVNMLDGQITTFEVCAVGGNRRVACSSYPPVGGAGADSTGKYVVPRDRVGFFRIYRSARDSNRTFLLSFKVEP